MKKPSIIKFTNLYQEYASLVTDAPPIYAKWMSYVILSSVLNRNIWMRFGYRKIYPNMYILLVGPSSVYRKSYSQNLACNFIEKIYPDFYIPDISSREAFLAEMCREDRIPGGVGLVKIDEMSGFLRKVRVSQHFASMIEDLSSLFDGSRFRRRKGVDEKEKVIYNIEEPFLNITAACSEDWLNKTVETSDIAGGFLARFIWVIPPNKLGPHWAEPGEDNPEHRGVLVHKLMELKDFIGEIMWGKEGRKKWKEWYSSFRNKFQGGRWDAHYERLTLQTRKLAMLNAAQRLDYHINEEDLEMALDMTHDAVKRLDDIVVGENKDEVVRNKILRKLRAAYPEFISRSQLLNIMPGVDAFHLTSAMDTLDKSELIDIEIIPSGAANNKRAKTMYRFAMNHHKENND